MTCDFCRIHRCFSSIKNAKTTLFGRVYFGVVYVSVLKNGLFCTCHMRFYCTFALSFRNEAKQGPKTITKYKTKNLTTMKKLFFLASALFCASISASAVDYLVQTGKEGDAKWTADAISALGVSADNVIDLSVEGAAVPMEKEIWFAAGIYEFTATYSIQQGTKLYGGFAGTETSVDARALVSGGKSYDFVNPTVFNTIQPTEEEAAPVTLFPENKANVVLNGLTVQGSVSAKDGGAIKLGNNSEIKCCKFLNNTSGANKGGAIIAYNVSLIIENCYFEGNRGNAGGALYVASGAGSFGKYTMLIAHNVFVGNAANATGGALHIQGACTIMVDANVIYNNTSIGHSGAIYDNGGNISVITNNVVFNNSYLGTNNTCCYIKPKYFANNTICRNQGNVYFATNTDSAMVANNVIWGNLQGEATTGVSFANAEKGLTALNNYTSNAIPVTGKGLILSQTEDIENTNRTFSVQSSEEETKFVNPTSFVGAVDAAASDKDELLAELAAADWSLQEGSILIDAGTDLAYVTEDVMGRTREIGKYDVGAYEYVGGGVGSSFENIAKPAVDIRAALQAGEVYNILGQRVSDIQAGNIYIVSGQKMLVR